MLGGGARGGGMDKQGRVGRGSSAGGQFATQARAEADVTLSVEEPQTAIRIRDDEPLHDDDIVLIHMGAGVARDVVGAVMRNYEAYVGLGGGAGMFCVSVYGEVNGVTRDDIFAVMAHKKFGEARYGDVRTLFTVLPTTISDPNLTSEVAALQVAHFDIVVPKPGDIDLGPGVDLGDLTDDQYEVVELRLREVIESKLLPLFEPRGAKYPEAEVKP